MKRILVSALLCTSLFAAAQAQTTHTVKLVDTQLQDVLNVLEDMDIYIHRFDVSQFLDATYNVEVYVEEYKNNQKTGIIRKSKFPQNPKRSVRFSGKRTKRSVQKRKARNTQKAETKVL